ncbi:MAG: lactonase family protein [Saprospiraceae bacterium]
MKYIFSFILISLFFSCENNSNADTNTSTKTDTTETDMKEQYLFIGTYTKKEGHVDGKGKGIYRLAFSQKGDSIYFNFLESKYFPTINPSYLTISKNKKYLYAVNELGPNDGNSGTVEAYKIDPQTKDLKLIDKVITEAFAPCHVTVDDTDHIAFVSNYVGGIVNVFPLDKNGTFKSNSLSMQFKGKGPTDRQEASHPHSATISPNNQHVFVADLGTDKITGLAINYKKEEVLPTKDSKTIVQPGAGPRHMSFHPNGKIAYVVNELDATVNTFDYNSSNGSLTEKQSISTLPADYSEPSWCADIHVHPSGKFVYASNRGHNSIAIFSVDEKTGTLSLIKTESTKGDFPRNFVIDPTGDFLWVANQNSDSIFIFKINQKTGELREVGNIEIPTPVCLKFL